MSDHDEARQSGQAEAGSTSGAAGHGSQTGKGGSWVPFFIGLLAAIAVGWGLWPSLLYSSKAQPFSFNHAIHTEKAGMQCEECHKFSDDGRFAGAPRFQDCLTCHTHGDRQNKDNPAETAFLEQFVTEDGELKGNPTWYSYSGQPDCVYFSHVAHIKMAKIKCEECHGDHGKTKELRPFRENRLTGYSLDVTEKMKMTDCGDCHVKRGKPENNSCFVCHK